MTLPSVRPTTAERWTESDGDLVEQLRDVLVTDGPVPFARYMAAVLYDRELGYYATRDDRPTRDGDYLTAPELHPIFGATLAAQVEEVWERLDRPVEFTLREEAAGSGSLGLAVLDHLVAAESPSADAVRYQPIETSPGREIAARERLIAAGHGGRLASARDPVTAAGNPGSTTGEFEPPMTGMILANELLDALPVHRVTMLGGELLELHVDWRDGWFTEVALAPSTPDLASALTRVGVELVEGQVAEVGLEAATWARGLGAGLERGLVMIIDYGHPARALYDPVLRPAGLLRTYHRHHVGDDPYRFVGRQDLTSHVDWTTIELSAADGGLEVLGRTTQAEALSGLGLGDRLVELQSQPGVTAEAYALARASVMRLLDPRAMGGFGVLLLGRGIATEPPMRSLAFRLLRRPPDPSASSGG
ncbi:MAG TPA: SAM-dependent methyltransferase [Candidatus Saccharimonadia bacterium]|nr:SAM-dependent methyltransferase [Candidatus Saccharimonadia bacterium]